MCVPTTHLQYLQEANLYESAAEAENREHVLGQLDRIVKDWVKAVHAAEGYAQSLCEEVNGKIFTFGSYRLGVHGPGEVGSCQAHVQRRTPTTIMNCAHNVHHAYAGRC